MASTIASTLQQMLRFGVAAASLAMAVFIPDRSNPGEMIHGLHHALVALGGLTVVSTLVFRERRPDDGPAWSHHSIPALTSYTAPGAIHVARS
jgi:hypothetical protein